MKKKIGDLTLRELSEIKKQCGDCDCFIAECSKCEKENPRLYALCDIYVEFNDEDLDQEIEVSNDQRKIEKNMNKEIEKETYIDFTVSDYSLARILYVLDNNGVKDYAVTLEDNDLHIRIPKSHLQKVVYPEIKDSGEKCCCGV